MQIGKRQFADGNEAKQFIRHMLAKYAFGSPVSEPDDIEFLKEMVRRHPKLAERLSQGVREFVVVRNRRQKATELKLVLLDGQELQMPWAECVL